MLIKAVILRHCCGVVSGRLMHVDLHAVCLVGMRASIGSMISLP